MDFSRCVVVNVSEYVWERILPYMMRKSKKYCWITTTRNELYKSNSDIMCTYITAYIWWDGNKNFSATPLRSRIKRVKQRIIKNDTIATLYFKLSRSRPTKHFLDDLVRSSGSMGGSNITLELKKYLTSLMHNTFYLATSIVDFIKKVDSTQKPCQKETQPKVNPPSQKESTEQSLETPQPSTSQAEGENQSKTHMTRGVKKLLGMRMLKLLGHVSRRMKDMSVNCRV